MTNYREILRLRSLGINHSRIAESMGIARQTVVTTLQRASVHGIAVAKESDKLASCIFMASLDSFARIAARFSVCLRSRVVRTSIPTTSKANTPEIISPM